MELSISILNAVDRSNIIKILNDTNVSYIHMDVMDGKFVPEVSLSCTEFRSLSGLTNKKLDVHLMMEDPMEYIKEISDIDNVWNITIHLEIDKDIKKILSYIDSLGIKRGISIKPNTDIDKLIPYLDDIDLILVMTVEPGLGGQKFIEDSIKRISDIKNLIKDRDIVLEVDGGINSDTIDKVREASIAVVGSYITRSNDPIASINSLLV